MTASRLPALTDRTPTEYHDPVSMAAAAFLARYKTNSRRTYAVALRTYLNWCRLNGLDPMVANDRARENLDRHGNYILAAYMAGAT